MCSNVAFLLSIIPKLSNYFTVMKLTTIDNITSQQYLVMGRKILLYTNFRAHPINEL